MVNIELGGKVMKEFIRLRLKCYAYLMDDGKTKSKTLIKKEQKDVL